MAARIPRDKRARDGNIDRFHLVQKAGRKGKGRRAVRGRIVLCSTVPSTGCTRKMPGCRAIVPESPRAEPRRRKRDYSFGLAFSAGAERIRAAVLVAFFFNAPLPFAATFRGVPSVCLSPRQLNNVHASVAECALAIRIERARRLLFTRLTHPSPRGLYVPSFPHEAAHAWMRRHAARVAVTKGA